MWVRFKGPNGATAKRLTCGSAKFAIATLMIAASVGHTGLRFASAEEPRPPSDVASHREQVPARKATAPAKENLTFDGKHFPEWRAEFTTELNPKLRALALPALVKFGRYGYGDEVAQVLFDALGDDDLRFVESVTDALSQVGEPAIPFLMKVQRSSDLDAREHAAEALRRMDGVALEPLIDQFQTGGGEATPAIAEALAESDWHSGLPTKAVPRLLEAFKISQDDARAAMATVLGKSRSPTVFMPLFAAFVEEFKERSLSVFGDIGQVCVYRQGSLRSLPSTDSAQAEFEALIELAPRNLDRLAEIVRNGSPAEKYTACKVIEAIGPAASAIASSIVPLLTDDDRSTRSGALMALGSIGYGARSQLERLLQLSSNRAAKVAWLLWRVAPDDERVFSAVEKAVSSDYVQARAVVESFRREQYRWEALEVKDSPFTFGLSKEVEANPEKASRLLAIALRLRPPPAEEQCGSCMAETAICAVELLAEKAAVTTPALIALTESEQPRLRARAADALGAIGPPAVAALPALVKLESDLAQGTFQAEQQHIRPADESTARSRNSVRRTETVAEHAAAAIARIRGPR